MASTTRNITVNFGLLSVAASSEAAIIKAPEYSNLCSGQPGKDAHEHLALKAPSLCPECGEITDRTLLDKGVKGAGGTFTIVSQEDLLAAKEKYTAEFKGNLNVIPHPVGPFLAATAPGDSVNYLTPRDRAAEGHYALLTRLIEAHPELAFASLHTPVSVTALYMLTVREGVLVMEKRVREQSMKPIPSIGTPEVNEQLYGMLEAVLPTFTTDYDPAEYEDKYLAAVNDLVETGMQVRMDKDGPAVATAVPATDDALIAQLAALTKKAS